MAKVNVNTVYPCGGAQVVFLNLYMSSRTILFHAGLWMVSLFICVSEPMCSRVTPTVDCKVTVCAHVAIVYLVQQAS